MLHTIIHLCCVVLLPGNDILRRGLIVCLSGCGQADCKWMFTAALEAGVPKELATILEKTCFDARGSPAGPRNKWKKHDFMKHSPWMSFNEKMFRVILRLKDLPECAGRRKGTTHWGEVAKCPDTKFPHVLRTADKIHQSHACMKTNRRKECDAIHKKCKDDLKKNPKHQDHCMTEKETIDAETIALEKEPLRSQKIWELKFQRLSECERVHGDCEVTVEDDKELCQWVDLQRIEKLNSIGFCWDQHKFQIPLSRKKWTEEEDSIIIDAMQNKSRWINHLNPNLNPRAFSEEDDLLLLRAHKEIGDQWTRIGFEFFNSKKSGMQIRNRWNSKQFKRFIFNELRHDADSDGKSKRKNPDAVSVPRKIIASNNSDVAEFVKEFKPSDNEPTGKAFWMMGDGSASTLAQIEHARVGKFGWRFVEHPGKHPMLIKISLSHFRLVMNRAGIINVGVERQRSIGTSADGAVYFLMALT